MYLYVNSDSNHVLYIKYLVAGVAQKGKFVPLNLNTAKTSFYCFLIGFLYYGLK